MHFPVLCLSFRFGLTQKVFFRVACSVYRIKVNERLQHKFQTKSHLIRAFGISAAVIQQFHFAHYVKYVINARCTWGKSPFLRFIEISHENGLNNRNISIKMCHITHSSGSPIMTSAKWWNAVNKNLKRSSTNWQLFQIWQKQKERQELNCSTLNQICILLSALALLWHACVDSSNLIVYSNVYYMKLIWLTTFSPFRQHFVFVVAVSFCWVFLPRVHLLFRIV